MAHSGPSHDVVSASPLDAAGEPAAATMNMGTLRNVVVVRIASAGAGGITRAELRGDIAPLVAHRLSGPQWRRCLDELLFVLLTEGLVVTERMRMTITESGMAVAVRFLGVAIPARADWSVVRDVLLVGRALGVEVAQGSRRKKLESAHGLRGAILERSFGVPAARTTTLTGLRDKLARKAAPQATAPAGPKSPGGTTARSKTSRNRRAVERLLRRPREFASDAALLAELAAEQVGAQQTNVPSLRKAILRKLIGRPVDDAKDADQSIRTGSDPACPTPPPAPVTHAANPTGRPTGPAEGDGPGWIKAVAAAISAATSDPRQPDADTFLRAVLRAAHACAEGWPGNRRAYIANVWRQLFETHPDWMLTDDDFKARLIEAHKAGHLTLAYADLRSKDTIELVQASAVRDRNNEWHFVRIDD